jgi:hypothetical protein
MKSGLIKSSSSVTLSGLLSSLMCLIGFQLAAAAVKPLLHPLFSDHAVLQRDRAVPIWGWAAPGTALTIRFADQTKQAKAAADGKWSCTLDPLEASFEGRVLTVETTPQGARAEVRGPIGWRYLALLQPVEHGNGNRRVRRG